MATYNVAKGGFETNPLDCGRPKQTCIGMEKSDEVVVRGGVLRQTMQDICARLQKKNDCTDAVLAVGDFLEIFNLPTFSVLESFAVHIDSPTRGFAFNVSTTLANGLLGVHTTLTTTPAVGTAPCTKVSATEGNELPNGLGGDALLVRHNFDFTRQPLPIRSEVPNYLRLEITALPSGLVNGRPASICDLCMTFFIGIRRTAICHNGCPQPTAMGTTATVGDCAGCVPCTQTQTG